MPEANALVRRFFERLPASADLRILGKDSGKWAGRPWSEVAERAERVAAQLVSRQESVAGGTVALIGEPSHELVAGLLGAWLAGRPSTILAGPNRFASLDSWALRTEERLRILGVSDVYSEGTALKALDVQLERSGPIRLAHFDELATLPPARSSFEPVTRPVEAAAVYQGTAGSTGVAKSVELTASAVLSNVDAVLARRRFDLRDDVLCSWLPLYHDMGLMMLLAGVLSGAPTWLAATSSFARSPFDWLGWLTESQATVTAAPNFAYGLLGRYARVAGTADLGSLRTAINGGEPIDVAATRRFGTELSKFGFDVGAVTCAYGLAEGTCAVTMPAAGAGLDVDVVTDAGGVARDMPLLGAAVDGVAVRIADTEHVTELSGAREVGEIEFRSSAQMLGYLGEPRRDAGGWLGTGDLGYLIDGQLVVCGRSKELITIAGRNIFPQEIERVVADVPGVRPGGVVAVSGSGIGARRDQLVIVAEYGGDRPDDARQDITQRVLAECGITPGTVDFVEAGALPKTTSGKLRRVEVASRYREEGVRP